MRFFALAIAAVLMIAPSAPAAAQSDQTRSAIKGTGKYGAAGCGLGSMAFGDTPGAVQILAATTNAIFWTQLFGITTGTSNCGTGLFSAGTQNFVEANREALAKDISRGQGESIGALTVINQCQDSAAVGAVLQKNFKSIFPTESVSNEDVTKAILQTLQSEKATGCFQRT